MIFRAPFVTPASGHSERSEESTSTHVGLSDQQIFTSTFAAPKLVLTLALLFPAALFAAAVTAPARDWILPLFTKEGHRSMTARGTEARALSNERFQVADLTLTLFTGDVSATVDTIILSPAATFLPDDQRAFGTQHVRFIRDEVEASGREWTYDHRQKKISLNGDVRITFQAELTDLLQ